MHFAKPLVAASLIGALTGCGATATEPSSGSGAPVPEPAAAPTDQDRPATPAATPAVTATPDASDADVMPLLLVGRGATGIAVDETHVYFATSDETPTAPTTMRIGRLPKRGGPVDVLAELPADWGEPRTVVLTAGSVFVASGTRTVVRVAKSGGTVDVVGSVAHTIGRMPIDSDATHAHWIGSDGDLRQASDSGTPISRPVLAGLRTFRRTTAMVGASAGAAFVVATDYDAQGAWFARVERWSSTGSVPSSLDIPARGGVPIAVRVAEGSVHVVWEPMTDVVDAVTLGSSTTVRTHPSLENLAVAPTGFALLVYEAPDPLGSKGTLSLYHVAKSGASRALGTLGHNRTGTDVATDQDAVYWVRRTTSDGPGLIERHRLR